MSSVRVLYICSAGHSGSTFTDMLLGGHSQMESLGEFSFIGKNLALGELCGCGVPVSDCQAWAPIFNRIIRERGTDLRQSPYEIRQWDTHAVQIIDNQQQTPAFLLGMKLRSAYMKYRYQLPQKLYPFVPFPPRVAGYVHNTNYLYNIIRETRHCQIVIDSSKNIFKALALYENNPKEIRIIFLSRDGRGVYLSKINSNMSQKEAVLSWVGYYKRALPLLAKVVNPEHLFKVRYEDLASQPETILKKICEFAGMSFEPTMLDFTIGIRHSVNGNRNARFNRQKKGIRLDELWRTKLTQEDLKIFNKYGGMTNHCLGYHD